jgi:hypothetical protein
MDKSEVILNSLAVQEMRIVELFIANIAETGFRLGSVGV